MSLWPTLLRVVLAVTLMLNGIAAAAAAVQQVNMQAQPVAMGSADMGSMHAAMPCHEQAAQAGTDKAVADKVHAGKTDCCKSSSCSCACPFTAQAMLHAWVPAPAVFLRLRAVRPLALGHPAPALPSLIRPPIV